MEKKKSEKNGFDSLVDGLWSEEHYKKKHWEGTFEDYVKIVQENPFACCSASTRIHNMIMDEGIENPESEDQIELGRKIFGEEVKVVKYNFFKDLYNEGEEQLFGIEPTLMDIVGFLKSASMEHGKEKRVLLLHGPVGSSKSTIAKLIKQGLERYTHTDEGAVYTFSWLIEEPDIEGDGTFKKTEKECEMHEDPLHLIPEDLVKDPKTGKIMNVRKEFFKRINKSRAEDDKIPYVKGHLCPACNKNFMDFYKEYNGDWTKVLKHVKVRRMIFSEKDRVGIGTFQPKDEKNQDSTELTGDINFRKIAYYGSDSDPRAFNFDGEFNVGNRGIVEFVEMLKLDRAFLYDLLEVCADKTIKPKKFPKTWVDEVVIGHTNEPEYLKLQEDVYMEALKDRTIKIDVPYVTRMSKEIKIIEKFFNKKNLKQHIAPHTFNIAALWDVSTRLEEAKNMGISLIDKVKLYDGQYVKGFTEKDIKQLREENPKEGMAGISVRYTQDRISDAIVDTLNENCLNPFMVMKSLKEGLSHYSLVASAEQREQYMELLELVKGEYETLIKEDVRTAIAADEESLKKLHSNYVDNVQAYVMKEKVKNRYTGELEEPNEKLMQDVEQYMKIGEHKKDEARRQLMTYIGALARKNKQFEYNSNQDLLKAYRDKCFNDAQDSIKLGSIVSNVVDRETQDKIDAVKTRLKKMDYCEICATDVLNYVASIFARGEIVEG